MVVVGSISTYYIILFHLLSFFFFFFKQRILHVSFPPTPSFLPCIVSFTVSLPVSDETSAGLVQILAALCTLEAGCVPLQVRGDSQDVLVVYLTSTAHTHGDSRLLCVRVEERCINANTVCAFFLFFFFLLFLLVIPMTSLLTPPSPPRRENVVHVSQQTRRSFQE